MLPIRQHGDTPALFFFPSRFSSRLLFTSRLSLQLPELIGKCLDQR